ncbi:MAG: carbohydrate kinase family protein [Bacilli bacterium]|nr:carbohydrate kinase family protein [Bacilli bacterium]
MKILCIGHVTYDVTFETTSFPLENTKNRYHNKEEYVGGPVAIASVLLARWGEEVELAGQAGLDENGRKIQKELVLNKVGISNLSLDNNLSTSNSFILANSSNGKRTIYSYTPKKGQLKPLKLDYTPDIILLDGYEYEASKKLLEEFPNTISILDASRENLETVELAKMVKYLICSQEFAESVAATKIDFNNLSTLSEVYTKMEETFKNEIIITLEERGCLYKENGQIKIMPSIKVKIVDTTAAGDIFHGAFVYALAHKFNFEKTIKFANIAGALSVTRFGGCLSIPTLKEVQKVYDQVK